MRVSEVAGSVQFMLTTEHWMKEPVTSKTRSGCVMLVLMQLELEDDLTICIPVTPPVPDPLLQL